MCGVIAAVKVQCAHNHMRQLLVFIGFTASYSYCSSTGPSIGIYIYDKTTSEMLEKTVLIWKDCIVFQNTAIFASCLRI